MPSRPTSRPADRALVAALPIPAVLTAGGWEQGGANIAFANREFCALTGYTARQLAGKNTRLLHGPRTGLAPLHRTGRRAGAAAARGENWFYRRDGGEFFAEWRYRRIAGARGPLVLVFQDHTELWRQREALLQSQKLGTVGLLASGVAHDFNNLLSLINGYCEILQPRDGTGEGIKELQEIHRAGLKAAAIARQILAFSRRREPEESVVNFNTLVREVADIIRRLCGDTIAVELRLASDLGNARIDPIHFQQVLLNLCFNARDAMPRGGKLTLRTANRAGRAAEGGGVVVLEVTDTGTGIPRELRDRIFEPFYTTKSHGTGLGLPTARGLVRQAGGRIELRRTNARGTTFEVLLPETAEPENAGATVLSLLPPTQGTESVLVVEQDESLRKMIAGILNVDGYGVSEAATIELALARQVRPQLVIADTATPAGVAALARLAPAQSGLRLISTAPRPVEISGLASGAAAHLPKPFALSALLLKVRAMLDATS